VRARVFAPLGGARQALRDRGVEATVLACDNGSWPLDTALRFGGVEARAFRAALREHAPHLVVCSWMPMGVDWTATFRSCASVREYVLLGELFDGACGHNWLTWGNAAFREGHDKGHDEVQGHAVETPPHERDGWTMREVPEVSRWQLSRFASDTSDCEFNSYCVSVRRGG